ncbi:MAG: fumarylacetoacetate hydrolase family protein [Rhodothermales bacterium]
MMEIALPTSGLVTSPGKLICIGRNYARHASEMQSDVPEEPVIFLKPPSALVGQGGKVVLPSASQDVHHELELVVAIGRGGKNIPVDEALNHVDGYGIGLDMTARDIQAEAKRQGLPWTVAKGFDTFAPLGALVSAHEVGDPQQLTLELYVNGSLRQRAHTAEMIFPVADLIAYSSTIFTLMPGDLIFTGTPEGVAAVEEGDRLEARGEGFPDLRIKVLRERRN